MPTKSEQLQIRVTPAQKASLRKRARRAGLNVSNYVLSLVLPSAGDRFEELVRSVADADERRFALAELNDLLTHLAPAEFVGATRDVDLTRLTALWRNYVAAMVEEAAHRKGAQPPDWVREVTPLEDPWYAVPFKRLRMYLLRSSPVAFKRRNLFVDASIGDRV